MGLVYLCRPGELCCGFVVNKKVCLKIYGTCPVGSHSNKYSMPVEGPMMMVRSAVNQVKVRASLNPLISTVGVDEGFIESCIKKTGCDWAQELSMFNYGYVKTEHVFEENIEALTTSKKSMHVLHSHVCIKERQDSTSILDSITELQGFLQTLAKPQ